MPFCVASWGFYSREPQAQEILTPGKPQEALTRSGLILASADKSRHLPAEGHAAVTKQLTPNRDFLRRQTKKSMQAVNKKNASSHCTATKNFFSVSNRERLLRCAAESVT